MSSWEFGGRSSPASGGELSDKVKSSSHVNVATPADVAHWCQKFGCSETQLRMAIKIVGVTVSKVRAHLIQRR